MKNKTAIVKIPKSARGFIKNPAGTYLYPVDESMVVQQEYVVKDITQINGETYKITCDSMIEMSATYKIDKHFMNSTIDTYYIDGNVRTWQQMSSHERGFVTYTNRKMPTVRLETTTERQQQLAMNNKKQQAADKQTAASRHQAAAASIR